VNSGHLGETADIQAVQELSTRSYIGCPNDSKKIPDAVEGKEAVCPKCGSIVKPRALQWALYLVGDSTGEIVASFPPSIMNRPTEGMWIVAEGLLGENEEFLVYRWSLPTEASKAPVPTDQPLTSFYRPVAAATVPNAPLPPAVPPAVSSASAATPTAAPTVPTAAPTVPTATSSATPSKQVHCAVCGTGPFLSQLELQGHKSTAHPVRRTRKVGSKSSSITGSKKPEEPVNVSTAPANVLTVPADIPIPAVPAAPSTPAVEVQAPAAAPVLGPVAPTASATTLPTASVVTPSAASVVTPPTASTPASTTPEIVGGTSAGAEKYAKLCGLVRKPLADFRNQFEASFPGHDIAKVMETAHCTVVDDKVAFIGGGEPKQ
jgi:hypothetical protein